jgi:ribokinase
VVVAEASGSTPAVDPKDFSWVAPVDVWLTPLLNGHVLMPRDVSEPAEAAARPRRIVVVGDVITDIVAMLASPLAGGSDTPAEIRVTGGGQAANTAAWLAWQGEPVTLVASVGDDEPGRVWLAELTGLGVHCATRRQRHEPTGTAIVLVRGESRTMITQRGANLRLAAEDIDAALAGAPGCRHLHLSGYLLLDAASRGAGLRALAVARERGLTVSVDAASAGPLRDAGGAAFLSWVRGADLLLANVDEAAVLSGGRPAEPAALALALTVAARNVVVKLGAAGAVWAVADAAAGGTGSVVTSAAPPARMVDPTGAGDAFAAGLLAAWLAGAGVRAALERGNRLGALAVSTMGARPAAGGDGS